MSDPWLKFYTSDWRSDPRLRMCSMAARGLWVEIVCLMHEASPYGHLLVHGRPPTDAQLAVLVGALPDECAALLGELESAGVFSRTKEGVIYSRKLTRMAKKAATARNNGRKGGNPTLEKHSQNKPLDKGNDKDGDKPQKPEARNQIEERASYEALPISVALEAYNDAARRVGWPIAQRLTAARKASLGARLKEAGGLDGWRTALEKAERSDFLCGRSRRGFKASIDFLLQASSFTKLMEGNYDNPSHHNGPPNAGGAGSGTVAAFAAVAKRLSAGHCGDHGGG